MTERTCEVYVSDGRMSWDCGKPAAGTVRDFDRHIPACKFHIGVYARREKQEVEHEAERQAEDHLLRQTLAKCQELKALGIPSNPHYYSIFGKQGHAGNVVVDPDILLDRLRKREGR